MQNTHTHTQTLAYNTSILKPSAGVLGHGIVHTAEQCGLWSVAVHITQ